VPPQSTATSVGRVLRPHTRAIYRKLDVHSGADAMARADLLGLVARA
jgi:ATP/maltotriose-dependent transcriptional regulator MalT